MKAAGLVAAAATGTAAFGSQGSAASVVDLGEEGLSDGDAIDPYLEEHFTDGTEVHVPAGEYEYTGDGLGGDKADCALVGSPDGVTFTRPGTDAVIRPTLWATSGTVRIENVTVAGKRGTEQSRWRVGAASDATVELVNVNMPDGTVEGSDSTGIYAGTDHAGTLVIRHCYFSNFGNVACYVSDPYVEGNGKVIVEDCDFVNTGMSALRLAPDNSEVRRCYFEATEKAASSHVGWNQRGIKIDDAGDDVVIEDCDFVWEDPGTMAINFDDKGEGGSGVFRDLRIRNDSSNPTFVDEWGVDGNWTGENVHLTGSGSHDVPSGFETVTGADAEEPNAEYEIWTPVGSESDSGGDDASGGSTATETAAATATATATATGSDGSADGIPVDGRTVVQAETGTLGGDASVRTYHEGYTGDGFVDLEPRDGGTVEWTLDVASAGTYDLIITHSQGDTDARTADFLVNGERTQLTFEPTGSWETWERMATTVSLVAGENTLGVETTGEDAGHLDALEFVPTDDGTTETPTDDGSDGDGDAATPTDDGSTDGGATADGETTDDGTSDGTTDGSSDGTTAYDKVFVVDGTGDAEEVARYAFSVSGEVEWNDEYSEVRDGGTVWDGLTDNVRNGRVVGLVGNAVDAYSFTGRVTDVDIRGKATFTIVRS